MSVWIHYRHESRDDEIERKQDVSIEAFSETTIEMTMMIFFQPDSTLRLPMTPTTAGL